MNMIERFKNDPEFQRRILMTFVGVTVCGISVGFFTYSNFGIDPFQTFAQGTCIPTGMNYGTYYMLLNAVLLITMIFYARKKIGAGTLINLFLLGYVADFSKNVLAGMFLEPSMVTRLILLAIGIVAMCFASAMYFTADLGVSTYDAIALTISETWPKLRFNFVRVTTDFICVLVGWLFGAPVGFATIISAFFMGPLISFFRTTVAEPMRAAARKN